MKTKVVWVMALGLAVLTVLMAIPGCKKEEQQKPAISAEDKAAIEKAAVEKAAADKAAADKAVADKLASEKAAVEMALADKAAADKMVADKAAADKAAMDKMAADKAAADKAAADAKAEAASLPPDLVLMKSEISQAMAQIDLTMAKLDVLSASTGNLKQPSQDAVSAIEMLDTTTQSIKNRAADMRDRGASYFDAWEKQLAAMSTPEVAAAAMQRRQELSAKYAEVLSSMQDSRAAFDPFWADMKAIHDKVADGVTADSVKSLIPQINSAREKAATLKSRVAVTSDMLNQVSVIYKRP